MRKQVIGNIFRPWTLKLIYFGFADSRASDVVVIESSDNEDIGRDKTKHNKVDSVIIVDDSDNYVICERTLHPLLNEQARARTDSVILISQSEKCSSPIIVQDEEQKSEPNFSRGKVKKKDYNFILFSRILRNLIQAVFAKHKSV